MHKNKTPNKIVKLVFEQVTQTDDMAVLKVYLEPTERALDDEMADSDDVTLAEVYSSEVMGMVTEWMAKEAAAAENGSLFQMKPKEDLN